MTKGMLHDNSYHILIISIILFSLSETALTAANKSKFQTEAKNGNQRSQKLSQLLDKPSEFITTILIIKI